MMSAQPMVVPSFLKWLLLLHVPTAIAIYAAVYAFGVNAVPLILAIIAIVLHGLLGLYLCVASRRAPYCHFYVVSVCLLVCAGLWCGPLSFFAWRVSLRNNPQRTWLGQEADRPLVAAWSKVGCAMSAWSAFVDLLLLAVLILRPTSKPGSVTSKDPYESSSASTTDVPPQLPPLTSMHHHRISLPYPPSSPTPTPTPPLSPPTHSTQAQPLDHHPKQHNKNNNKPLPSIHPPNHHHHPPNRIALILRLCALQNLPSGNWSYTPELGTLLNTWAQRSIVMPPPPPPLRLSSSSSSSSFSSYSASHLDPDPHHHQPQQGQQRQQVLGLTALAHACLTDLCHTVWAAQREGRENDVLSMAEMRALEGVGWDLGWVGWRIEVAGGWLRGWEREGVLVMGEYLRYLS
ncbi:hypothetical protein N658DRAFT_524414 [Parathielavia hyrcaniae]|uniref:Uncharacterized protein n=1 Tax=Parathielavia hyrcaniae TaxID=113614 RepID=A0AAN6PZL1_9PEZI|nr:hypothetical protein N658DRAFT_524414 [Parathielavia hyrcaniae]